MNIVVPNAERYAKLYIDKKWSCEIFSNMMFGAATNDFQHHYCCYDQKYLLDTIKTALGKKVLGLSNYLMDIEVDSK